MRMVKAELDRAEIDNASGKISGAQNDDTNPIPHITISSEDEKTEKVDEGCIEGLLCEEDEEGTGDAMNNVEGKDNDNLTNSKENKGD